jgi:hypothetical protein
MGKPLQQIHDLPPMSDVVPIKTQDFWVKVVEMLQQNWALIEPKGSKVTIYFLHDLGGVFDELSYSSVREAQAALRLNGFRRYDEDPSYSEMFARPEPPFRRVQHPNGPIYSSGEFWAEL